MTEYNNMSDYQIATEIPFSQLVDGKSYTFLWGPYDLFLSGVFVDTGNKNYIADFKDSRHQNGWNPDGYVANDNGHTATAGPFFPKNTRAIYVCKT